jgi:hypothetical protein
MGTLAALLEAVSVSLSIACDSAVLAMPPKKEATSTFLASSRRRKAGSSSSGPKVVGKVARSRGSRKASGAVVSALCVS